MYRRRGSNPYGGIPQQRRGRSAGTGRFKIFLIIGLIMAGYHTIKYLGSTQENPITGEMQRISWSMDEEIALGIQSAPQMVQQYGGLHPDQRAQDMVDEIGAKLVRTTVASQSEYPFDFHLLNDDRTVNAFALPGGQCFITSALYNRLKSIDQLAGVLGHEIGHVLHRHSAVRMQRGTFIQGLINSVMIGSGGDMSMAQVANVIGQMGSMKYGRDQELESDEWGVRLMIEAGYNPEELIKVMDILEEANGASSRGTDFTSSHPSPENRREKIKDAIKRYKNG